MTGLVLLAALVMASPSVYAAFTGSGSVERALLHLGLALVVAAVGGRLLRRIVTRYEREAAGAAPEEAPEEAPVRRRSDGDHPVP